jgi:hypothetical protein
LTNSEQIFNIKNAAVYIYFQASMEEFKAPKEKTFSPAERTSNPSKHENPFLILGSFWYF